MSFSTLLLTESHLIKFLLKRLQGKFMASSCGPAASGDVCLKKVNLPLSRPACIRLQVRAYSHTKKVHLLALAIKGISRKRGQSQVASG